MRLRTAATSVGSSSGKNAAFLQRLMDHAAVNAAPLADVVGAYDDEVHRHSQITQRLSETSKLLASVAEFRLHHEKIQIGAGARIAAGVRAEEDDARVGRGCGKAAACLCDEGVVNG